MGGPGHSRRLFAVAALGLAAVVMLDGQAAPTKYQVGQVWEYRTRPGDEGSLLKIQRIENIPKLGQVYHLSVIGFHLTNPAVPPILPHIPVSAATLDASVTRLSARKDAFPVADEGIAQWRKANGGVFTISVAEIVAAMDQSTKNLK
jgi:hypothetical protein